MTTLPTFTERDLSFELARRQFCPAFIRFVYILEPPPGRGTIPMELWPHILEVAKVLETQRLIVWLKARQIGASWLVAAWDVWNALFKNNSQIKLFSQGEDEAQEKLGKCKFIYDHLPPELQTPIVTDNLGELIFANGSKIEALPSTKKAGRGGTGSIVDFDEADFHEYFPDNYSAVKPIVDDTGGQVIVTSTSNWETLDSLFKDLYREAPGNGFYAMFYPWDVHPNRDDNWYERTQNEASDTFRFFKEYPTSAEVALAPPQELRAFNVESLDLMMQEVREPLEVQDYAHIYRKFSPGRRYAAGTDTSHGTGSDYGVTAILDVATLSVVADIMSNALPPEELAYQSSLLLAQYGQPIWVIEDNEWGGQTVRKALDLQYPSLYKRNENHVGWTTLKNTRAILWGDLIESTNSRSMTIFNKAGLSQYYNVQKDPKTGRIVSAKHDDYPMAVGLALQGIDLAHVAGGNDFDRFRIRKPVLARW